MEETSMPLVAKKIWSAIRVMFYMLKKEIIKKKLMVDMKVLMTRGKIAGRVIQNLMFHLAHHSNPPNSCSRHVSNAPREYEFSCSNSPAWFHVSKRKHRHHAPFFPCVHSPATDDDAAAVNVVRKALEMMNVDAAASPAIWHSALSSPAFGWNLTPVRRVRVTDSPYPIRDVGEDSHVDKAAEEFISRFRNELGKQNR